MKILIFGATGMLGNAMLRRLSEDKGLDVWATIRGGTPPAIFGEKISSKILRGVDVLNPDDLASAFDTVRPDVVINCIGLVKQLSDADDPLKALPINSILPHRLARLCSVQGARLIHVSTDCVFLGDRGLYREQDMSDAADLYGRSKLLGEVDYPHAITLRTSIIGHELTSANGLVGWFLSQEGTVRGFTKAIFSGVPTVELADIIRDYVLPSAELSGLYHVASNPISKFDLLEMVNREYNKGLSIEPSEALVIDRSLNADRFNAATGYAPASWPDLVAKMHGFK